MSEFIKSKSKIDEEAECDIDRIKIVKEATNQRVKKKQLKGKLKKKKKQEII